jgi:hypothetical protein
MERGGVTAPRITVANGTFAITRRTSFRKLFWTPSTPEVHQGYLYALALAQQKTGVQIHHGQLLPTHEHLTVTPTRDNLPDFFRALHRESARYLQELLLASGYDAPESVWDKRQTHAMRLVDAGAQAAWMLYAHTNCVAAGLVERVEDYPGFASDLGWLKGGGTAVKKPDLYYGKDGPEEVELLSTPSSLLHRAFDGDGDAMVYWLRKRGRGIEDALRDERRAKGMSVLGAGRIKAIHPWSEPRTPRERRGEIIPTFKVDGDGDPDVRAELYQALVAERRGFLGDHAEALDGWRAGDRSVSFPAGTYLMRALHRANVAPAYPGAILCAPDPVGEIARPNMDAVSAFVRETHAEHTAALSDITDGATPAASPAAEPEESACSAGAVESTAENAVEEASADEDETDDSAARGPRAAPTRPPPEATRLISPARTADTEHPSRLVTLRNRRDRDPP